jgi:hypothetical protein
MKCVEENLAELYIWTSETSGSHGGEYEDDSLLEYSLSGAYCLYHRPHDGGSATSKSSV